MTTPNLLPRNRTPFEAAVEQVDAERYPLPTHLVKAVWSPDDCPSHLLAYLAWGMSVDVWDDAWPDVTKREVIRNALKLHRLKTTLAGIKAHVALTGATVNRAIRPPATQFLRGAMTEEQRLAWLDNLPQVRIYPFATRVIATRRHFANGHGVHRQFHRGRPWRTFTIPIVDGEGNPITGTESAAELTDAPLMGQGFLRASRGPLIYGRRATFYDRGVETDITLTGLEGNVVERVLIGTPSSVRLWHGANFAGRGFITRSTADTRVVTIRQAPGAEAFAIERGMEPVDVRPKRIAQPRTAPAPRSFFGRVNRFLLPTNAPLMLYDRIALNEPGRITARRKVLSWHGHGRFGMAPYTAELRLSVPMRRPKRTSGRWHGVGHRRAASMARLDMAIEAVRVSKAFRDTVLIDTANYGRATFGGGLRFGEFTFGQIREVD